MDPVESIGENLRHLRGMGSLGFPQIAQIFAEAEESI